MPMANQKLLNNIKTHTEVSDVALWGCNVRVLSVLLLLWQHLPHPPPSPRCKLVFRWDVMATDFSRYRSLLSWCCLVRGGQRDKWQQMTDTWPGYWTAGIWTENLRSATPPSSILLKCPWATRWALDQLQGSLCISLPLCLSDLWPRWGGSAIKKHKGFRRDRCRIKLLRSDSPVGADFHFDWLTSSLSNQTRSQGAVAGGRRRPAPIAGFEKQIQNR